MTIQIAGTRPDPTLCYDVTDAATGAPMRLTVYCGVVACAFEGTGMVVVNTQKEAGGFYVPNTQPLPPGPDPVIVAEVSISNVGLFGGHGAMAGVHHGVGDVTAQLTPSPQRDGQRWLYVSFTYYGVLALALRYRVTLYQPRG